MVFRIVAFLPEYLFSQLEYGGRDLHKFLSGDLPNKSFNIKAQGDYLFKGYTELVNVFNDLKKNKRIKRFLSAFFVYIMAVQTIMYMGVTFGKDEIEDMPDSGLIVSILIIQIIAIGGAYFFSFLSALIGNIRTLSIIMLVWIISCIMIIFHL